MYTVVGTGTALWLLGAVGLLVAHLVGGRPLDIWFTTCVTGALPGEERDTDPAGTAVHAWGDPAVIARCGLPALGPTTEQCISVDGVDWVRVSYLQPAEVRPGLLDAMTSTPGVAPWFDLSFQHASPTVLRRLRTMTSARSAWSSSTLRGVALSRRSTKCR